MNPGTYKLVDLAIELTKLINTDYTEVQLEEALAIGQPYHFNKDSIKAILKYFSENPDIEHKEHKIGIKLIEEIIRPEIYNEVFTIKSNERYRITITNWVNHREPEPGSEKNGRLNVNRVILRKKQTKKNRLNKNNKEKRELTSPQDE